MSRQACAKIGYPTRAAAIRAQTHVRNRAGHRDVGPYECEFCGAWHLGGQRDNLAARRRRNKAKHRN